MRYIRQYCQLLVHMASSQKPNSEHPLILRARSMSLKILTMNGGLNKHNIKKSYTWAWVWLSWHVWHRGHCPQTRWPKMPLQLPEHLSMIVWVELKLFLLEGTWWRWTGTSGPWLSKAIERFHEWRVKMASGGIKGYIGKVTQTHSCLPLEWEDRYFSDIAESPSELWCLAYTSVYQGSLECQPLFDF